MPFQVQTLITNLNDKKERVHVRGNYRMRLESIKRACEKAIMEYDDEMGTVRRRLPPWTSAQERTEVMDIDDFVKEVDQSIEWFCDKIVEPGPINPQDKEKIMKRMATLGWLRESEIETYKMATRED